MYNELQHHGIKGQKWGVRRFQKKDGSLTPAGKKRYNDDVGEPKKKTIRVAKAFVETYAMDSVTGLVSATLIKNGQEGVGKMVSVAGGAMSWASLAKKLYDIATDKDEK